MASESVTIIGGTGDLGTGLARRFAAAGVPVMIGSRDEGRAREAASAIEGDVDGMANHDACKASEIVFLCVPFAAQASNLSVLAEHVSADQLVVDATVPLATAVGGKAAQVLAPWHGSCAQTAQAALKATVVSALHTVSAPTLQDLSATLDEDVLVCGRKRDDKRRVARVIEQIDGLRCIDAGPLEMSRIVETQTALLIGINGRYKTHAGIKLTGLPDGDLFPPLKK